MINIVAALYYEAKPFIHYFQLKKNSSVHKFQLFYNEEIRLVITGTGSIPAAVGVTWLNTLYPPSASDLLVNMGVCAASDRGLPEGTVLLCNKITEQATDRFFYPDILLKHPFDESEVITCNNMIKTAELPAAVGSGRRLYDMEAAGVYQAGAYFYQPHQMIFLKIISDYGQADKVTPGMVTGLIEKNLCSITSWLEWVSRAREAEAPVFTEEEECHIKELSQGLQCSVTMDYKLRQLLHYYKLTHGSTLELVKKFTVEAGLPCTTKVKGKIYFEQLEARIL